MKMHKTFSRARKNKKKPVYSPHKKISQKTVLFSNLDTPEQILGQRAVHGQRDSCEIFAALIWPKNLHLAQWQHAA